MNFVTFRPSTFASSIAKSASRFLNSGVTVSQSQFLMCAFFLSFFFRSCDSLVMTQSFASFPTVFTTVRNSPSFSTSSLRLNAANAKVRRWLAFGLVRTHEPFLTFSSMTLSRAALKTLRACERAAFFLPFASCFSDDSRLRFFGEMWEFIFCCCCWLLRNCECTFQIVWE